MKKENSKTVMLLQIYSKNNFLFQPARMSRVGKFGRIIITAEDGGSLLRYSERHPIFYIRGFFF